MSVDRKQAEKVSDALGEELMPVSKRFNLFAGRLPIASIGPRKDAAGFYVSIALEREPKKREWKKLPLRRDGVRVKYSVTGKNIAL